MRSSHAGFFAAPADRGGRGEQCERRIEPLQKSRRCEQPNAGGRELDRQREVVEPPADRADLSLCSPMTSPGRMAFARSMNNAAASCGASVASGSSCSPAIRSGSRVVTRARRRGAAASSPATRGAASSTCSKLSRTRRSCRSASSRPSVSASGSLVSSRTASTRAIDDITCSWRLSGARSTKKTPLPNSGTSPAAISIASRVFPEPPGPVSVTRRSSPRSLPVTSATSSSRPISGDGGVGRFELLRLRSGGNSASPSW